MIYLKNEEEIELLRENNLLVSRTLAEVGRHIRPGVTTKELDRIGEEFIRSHGAVPAFLGYSLAAGHKTLLPAIVEELKKRGREDIMVCIGGVIPAQDYDYLYEHGAAGIFGPGTNIPKCCIQLLQMLVDRAKAEHAED